MTHTERTHPPDRAPAIQDYTPLAATYDAERYVEELHQSHERRRRRVLLGLLPPHVDLAADIACGTGRGMATLTSVATTVIGVDGTLAMLGVIRQKVGPAACVAQANAAALPFANGTFDLMVCLNFLHLFPGLEEKRAFVGEMGRVLKPGGVLVAEFDNAMQGLVLGAARKYFGKDIGYDWPWHVHRVFRPDLFAISQVSGANLPFLWRVPMLRSLDNHTGRFPLNYLATRLFVRAVRR